ncbi:MAG TPA: IPT/TIG domain-containing protein, partial [Bradyrhizobium sp.]|nr:IPT/TIG domain-containing protein [Bradyrhizobium sp.]
DPKPLTITGTDFDKAAKATINGKDRPVQWASATQLTVTTAADDVVTAGKVKLAIKNPNADAAELMIDVVEPHN